MQIQVNCIPSDWSVNVDGVDRFFTTNDTVIFIVDETPDFIVDENGNFLTAGASQSITTVGAILVNCIPSDWFVNTE